MAVSTPTPLPPSNSGDSTPIDVSKLRYREVKLIFSFESADHKLLPYSGQIARSNIIPQMIEPYIDMPAGAPALTIYNTKLRITTTAAGGVGSSNGGYGGFPGNVATRAFFISELPDTVIYWEVGAGGDPDFPTGGSTTFGAIPFDEDFNPIVPENHDYWAVTANGGQGGIDDEFALKIALGRARSSAGGILVDPRNGVDGYQDTAMNNTFGPAGGGAAIEGLYVPGGNVISRAGTVVVGGLIGAGENYDAPFTNDPVSNPLIRADLFGAGGGGVVGDYPGGAGGFPGGGGGASQGPTEHGGPGAGGAIYIEAWVVFFEEQS